MKVKRLFHSALKLLVRYLGMDLTDGRTGEKVARALVVGFGGRIYLLGYEGKDQVIPVFLPQKKLSFWKREIGFTSHPPPDFPREAPSPDEN